MTSEPFYIWEGIYETFEEAGGSTEVFAERGWVERSKQKGTNLRSQARSSRSAPACHEYCIPIVVALLQARRRHVRVLEFGGSVGFTFHSTVDALARPQDVEIHVLDNERICAAGKDVFAGEERISFHSRLPEEVSFDVVHFGSSIQYVPAWAAQIKELASLRPEFLVFDDLPAGDIRTFVSAQNYYGKKIPHWFFNIDAFIDTVTRETDYRLCYKAQYVGTLLGKTGPLPMENFPADHRIEHAYNLVFSAGNALP